MIESPSPSPKRMRGGAPGGVACPDICTCTGCSIFKSDDCSFRVRHQLRLYALKAHFWGRLLIVRYLTQSLELQISETALRCI